MARTTVTRILEFDAGHRVMDHEGKCATLHGHRYRVEIEAYAPGLDPLGRVIDFSVLKEKIGTWLDEMWDHTTIVWEKDEQVVEALKKLPRAKEPYVSAWNPTAENMAQFLLEKICPERLAGTGVEVVRVKIHETPNCSAEVWIR